MLKQGMTIASHPFSPKNRICYRNSKLNKNYCDYFDFFNKKTVCGALFGCELRLFRHNYISGEKSLSLGMIYCVTVHTAYVQIK